ncbi:YolD-like family protein [Paenibacillus sp. USHLN196]|uniref:YolD-like family protein n=1 Tax=Paenibacillus sp. USHLN196 TaxID=3081291 RepID=UPI0030160711
MSKKLSNNGLFESSRIILPEHREAYTQHMSKVDKKAKPLIDEQEWQQIGVSLSESLRQHVKVTLTLYDPYQFKELTGLVSVINTSRKEIKFHYDDDWDWISFDKIVSARI